MSGTPFASSTCCLAPTTSGVIVNYTIGTSLRGTEKKMWKEIPWDMAPHTWSEVRHGKNSVHRIVPCTELFRLSPWVRCMFVRLQTPSIRTYEICRNPLEGSHTSTTLFVLRFVTVETARAFFRGANIRKNVKKKNQNLAKRYRPVEWLALKCTHYNDVCNTAQKKLYSSFWVCHLAAWHLSVISWQRTS